MPRFLEGPLSNLRITEDDAMPKHCLTTVTCLLASFRLLDETNQDRFRQILKGLFGLQLYACEFWTEHVLQFPESKQNMDTESPLYTLLSELAERLDVISRPPDDLHNVSDSELDKRLGGLQQHDTIYKQVKMALWARSLDQVERQLKVEHSEHTLMPLPCKVKILIFENKARKGSPQTTMYQYQQMVSQLYSLPTRTCWLKSCRNQTFLVSQLKS